jgi:hypothetical protein
MGLREATLSPICLYPDGNVANVLEFENLAALGRVIRNKGRFLVVGSECDRRVVVICLTLNMSNFWVTSPSEISSARVLEGR